MEHDSRSGRETGVKKGREMINIKVLQELLKFSNAKGIMAEYRITPLHTHHIVPHTQVISIVPSP